MRAFDGGKSRIENGEIGSIKHLILCAWEFQFSDLTLEI